tara:strand:- start:383 stop:1621 length:1239 start_codon:yes stop_codon:yes gene_type:complete
MIYPLVIHPDFFHSIYGKEIPKNFNKFYQKLIYDDSHREKFFFIDDLNDTIQNLYKDIIKNVLPGDPIKIILEELIKQVTGGNIKREKISKKINISKIDHFIDDLDIKYYFKNENDFNNIKKTEKSYRLNEIDLLKFNELIIDLTKFGKKIIFFDPYIIQHMSNLLDKDYNKTGLKNIEERFLDIKQNNIDHEFSFEINKISNDYKVSLKKMLNLIYDNNIYKDDIEILIVTAIKNNDIDKFIENLKNFKEKYINKEDNLEIKEKFVNFYNSICNSIYNDNSEKNVINENMQSVIKNCLINPTRRKNNISIKIVNEREREKKTVLRFYNKAIKVKGNSINTVVEVGNSLNFFLDCSKLGQTKKIQPKIKTQSSFRLELKDSVKEKKSISTPSSLSDFKLTENQQKSLKLLQI